MRSSYGVGGLPSSDKAGRQLRGTETGRISGLIAQARTVAVNLIAMIERFYLFNCRSLRHSMRSPGLFSNPWAIGGSAAMIGLQILFTCNPWMNTLFHSAPLSIEDWAVIVAVSVAVSPVVGAEKWLRERSWVRVPEGEGGKG